MSKALQLLDLQKQVFESETLEAFGFVAANKTHDLIKYKQAIFFLTKGDHFEFRSVSGNSVLDEKGPYAQWLSMLLKIHKSEEKLIALDEKKIDEDLLEGWNKYTPHHLIVLQFYDHNKHHLGGLIVERDSAFNEAERTILEELAFLFASALELHIYRTQQGFFPALFSFGRYQKIILGALLILSLFPVRLSVSAPAEIVAKDPVPIVAPYTGVLENIEVSPGQHVSEADLLLRMDSKELSLKKQNAEQELSIAKENLSRLERQVLLEPERKPEIQRLRSEIDLKSIDYEYASKLLAESEITSPIKGVAVFSDVNSVLNKPLNIGDKIIEIADLKNIQLRIRIPVASMIALSKDSDVSFYMNAQPLSSYDAGIRNIGFQASPDADGLLTYKVTAFLPEDYTPRIGWQGTATLYGDRTIFIILSAAETAYFFAQFIGTLMAMSEEKPPLQLPRLNPVIRLFKSGDTIEGKPSWTLYNPVSNQYYQIGWAEFECISRLIACKDADELVERVNTETPLEISHDDVKELLHFLNEKALLEHSVSQAQYKENKKSFLLSLLHHYLFFTIPLFKPEKFLRATYPLLRPLFSRKILYFVLLSLAVLILLTLQRSEEFFTTFLDMFSMEGMIVIGLTLIFMKVMHEFGHAYAAHRYGIEVPHMGIAFMVLYPVLYTETSASWQVSSRRKRIYVGLAGVFVELTLATIALAVWNFSSSETIQSMAFAVVAIGLIGSLFVNLNPLMRFDGYFVLSDNLGIENLHARGFAFARWWLRKTLFGLDDYAPEDMPAKIQSFLIVFGLATIIYRFFLFLGIALLVYWLFFKPLGLILMIIELAWFIGYPLIGELKIWWERRVDILQQSRSYYTGGVFVFLFLISVAPMYSTITLPAVLEPVKYRAFYPPEDSKIEQIFVRDNQALKQGMPIIKLRSDKLDYDLEVVKAELVMLRALKRSGGITKDPALRADSLEKRIAAKEERLISLEQKEEELFIKAPFDGVIKDFNPYLREGVAVSRRMPLFKIVELGENKIIAYAYDNNLSYLQEGQSASFRPGSQFFVSGATFEIEKISRVNENALEWAELSSVHGGPIASEVDPESEERALKPRQAIYAIHLISKEEQNIEFVQKGYVHIHSGLYSPALSFGRFIIALVQRELSLN